MNAVKHELVNETQTAQTVENTVEISEGDLVHTMMSCSLDDGTDMFDGDAVHAMMSCS